MKTLMVAALAVAAIGANIAFAEEYGGIVSAASAIADPDMRSGMLFNGYALKPFRRGNFDSMYDSIKSAPSVKTVVTTADKLSFDMYKDVQIVQGKWEGFLKCMLPSEYTFVVTQNHPHGPIPVGRAFPGYQIYVNGTLLASGGGQHAANVKLKIGYNKIVVVAQGINYPVSISYRPSGSLEDPRLLTPAMMYYEKPVIKGGW